MLLLLLVVWFQSILLSVSYTSIIRSQCRPSLLFSTKKNINYNFKTLETEPHIVFMEYVLYTRAQEYRDKYTFSDSNKFTEIMENMHKYILYPLNEDDYYKVDEPEKVEIVVDETDEIYEIDEGFHEFSMEKSMKFYE